MRWEHNWKRKIYNKKDRNIKGKAGLAGLEAAIGVN